MKRLFLDTNIVVDVLERREADALDYYLLIHFG